MLLHDMFAVTNFLIHTEINLQDQDRDSELQHQDQNFQNSIWRRLG